MSESSNICLPCGLCCDGTLIGFVELAKEELDDIQKIKEIEVVDGKGFFLHPCTDFCDYCTIYHQRPKQCASFKCGVLKSVEKEELAFESAVQIIHTVKQQKLNIEKKIAALNIDLKSNSFYFKMLEVKNLLNRVKSQSGLSQKQQELTLDIQQLQTLIAAKFDLS